MTSILYKYFCCDVGRQTLHIYEGELHTTVVKFQNILERSRWK